MVGQEVLGAGSGLEGRLLCRSVRQSYVRVHPFQGSHQPSNCIRPGEREGERKREGDRERNVGKKGKYGRGYRRERETERGRDS